MNSMNPKKITYLDSSTIGIFIHYYQMLKDAKRFVLAGLQDSLIEVFDMAKLYDIFEIFPYVPRTRE